MTNEGVQAGLNFAIIFSLSLHPRKGLIPPVPKPLLNVYLFKSLHVHEQLNPTNHGARRPGTTLRIKNLSLLKETKLPPPRPLTWGMFRKEKEEKVERRVGGLGGGGRGGSKRERTWTSHTCIPSFLSLSLRRFLLL